jgi:hypothetical protein
LAPVGFVHEFAPGVVKVWTSVPELAAALPLGW